jgi:hypothetical protein
MRATFSNRFTADSPKGRAETAKFNRATSDKFKAGTDARAKGPAGPSQGPVQRKTAQLKGAKGANGSAGGGG